MNINDINEELIKMCPISTIEAQHKDDITFYVKLKGYKSTKYIPITTGQLRKIERILAP